MQNFLEFLIVSLRTINGERNSAMKYFSKKAGIDIKKDKEEGFLSNLFCTKANRKAKKKLMWDTLHSNGCYK